MLLSFIILYLLMTILIGLYAARRIHTASDFILAGRSLPLLLSTSALFATWFGSETVFGASSEFLKGGLYSVIEDPFGAALCLFLFGRFFARKFYSMNLLTLCDYFKVRFGKKTEFFSSIFMIPSYFGYTAGQLVALALILNVVTGIPTWQGVVISSTIVTAYTIIGGMWAISITDFIQSIAIIAGMLVLAIVLSTKAGGVMTVLESAPPETFRFLPKPGLVEFISFLAAWSVLGLGSIPSQDIFQRVMSSGSEKIAIRSCYYSSFMYLTIAMLPLFISLCIKHLYGDSLGNGDQQHMMPSLVIQHTGFPVQVLFFGALLSAIMSTTSASLLAPASILSENIIKPMAKRNLTDKQLLLTTRLSILMFSIIASIMACLHSNIYELVGGSSILSLVSLFIPLIMGLYWKRANSLGAITAMSLGMVVYLYFEWFPISIPSMVPGVLASLVGMVLGSYSKKHFINKQ